MSLSVRLSKTGHAKYVIALALACSLMLLILPSCGIPHLRQATPGAVVPPSFNGVTSADSSALVPIEDFFNDPLLSSLICQGLANNQNLKILLEDVQIASNEVLGRSGAYLPFVGLGADAGLEKYSDFTPLGAAERQLQYLPGKNFPYLPGNFLIAANFSWQIDIWRMLRNSRDAAALRFLATNEGRNYVVTRLVADIADDYYGLLALDKRLENLEQILKLQRNSLKLAEAKMESGLYGPSSKLPVLRFRGEIRMNESQILITRQSIIQLENSINFLVGRFPQRVDRNSRNFLDLNLRPLCVGTPAQLLQNRPDIRQAERELAAAGLDVKVARARFFPSLNLAGPTGPTGPYSPIGFQAFNPKYLLWTPQSLLVNFAGDLTVPFINKRAIRADYKSANARQLQSVYSYQRVILNAFTEVVNRMTKVQNYSNSIELKNRQVDALEAAVETAMTTWQLPIAKPTEHQIDYLDVLFAQRDLWEARLLRIETKQQQLSAIVGVYQALGGGLLGCGHIDPAHPQPAPTANQSPQGGSNPYVSEPLPAPNKLPEQPAGPKPAPPDKPAGAKPAPPDQLNKPRKLLPDLSLSEETRD